MMLMTDVDGWGDVSGKKKVGICSLSKKALIQAGAAKRASGIHCFDRLELST